MATDPFDAPDSSEDGGELFDGDAYNDPRLKLTTRDGRRVNKIVVGFSGGVELERLRVDDVELFKGLHLGDEVEFTVTAIVAADTDSERISEKTGSTVVEKKTLKVHSLEVAA